MDYNETFRTIYSKIEKCLRFELEYSTEYKFIYLDPADWENAKPLLAYNNYYEPEDLIANLEVFVLNELYRILQSQLTVNYISEEEIDKHMISLKSKINKAITALEKLLEIFSKTKGQDNVHNEFVLFEKNYGLSLSKFRIKPWFDPNQTWGLRLRGSSTVIDWSVFENDFHKINEFIKKHITFLNDILNLLNQFQDATTKQSDAKPPKIIANLRPELTEDQILLLFYYLRKNKVLHPEAASKAVATGLEYMTGFAWDPMRKKLPAPKHPEPQDNLECHKKEKIESIIEKLEETIISLRQYSNLIVKEKKD
jgi:hypothetical protein